MFCFMIFAKLSGLLNDSTSIDLKPAWREELLKAKSASEEQGAKWKPRATPLNFLQMVTTKDPRPKLARVVIDLKPAGREELRKAKSSSATPRGTGDGEGREDHNEALLKERVRHLRVPSPPPKVVSACNITLARAWIVRGGLTGSTG